MSRDNADTYEVVKLVDPQTGFVYLEQHLKNGQFHREDGPANIVRFTEDRPAGEYHQVESWYIDGVRARRDGGPVTVSRDMPHDVIFNRTYAENGKYAPPPRPELEI